MRTARYISLRIVIGLAICACLIAAGCNHENLPVYQPMDAPATLSAMARQAGAVRTVSARASISLIRNDGQSVQLDGAIAMRPPDYLRLRAWKLSQAVLDVTLTPDGIWIIAPDDPSRQGQIVSANANAGKLAETWVILQGKFFSMPGLTSDSNDDTMYFTKSQPDQSKLVCEIDRATLTVRGYNLIDSEGHQQFQLVLDHYNNDTGIIWAHRLTAISPDGKIVIELHDLEFNTDLPPGAFIAPRRAEKLP